MRMTSMPKTLRKGTIVQDEEKIAKTPHTRPRYVLQRL